MITVIIAGGSGTRLWPLSTNNYPKHLLTLTNDRSMLQNTFDRAKLVSENTGSIYVVPEASHAEHVYTQLPELPKENILVEPGRRGTASCVVAALARIAERHEHDEPIVFMHADHHIRDTEGFVNTLKHAGKTAAKTEKIVLLGVEPDYPATGFGYIEKGDSIGDNGFTFVYQVDSFKEKPNHEVAQQYVHSGNYLWNMGYFVAPLNVFLHDMKDHAPAMFANYEALQKVDNEDSFKATYLSFESEPIDTALIEKTPDLLVVPGSFDWMDVGSFNDLHGVSDLDEQNNHLRGEDIELDGVENAYIRNDEGKPIAIIGLDNIVVVNTKDGVLVARKDLSQKVGDIAKKIQAQQ